MGKKEKCAFCGGEVGPDAVRGVNTGLPYCPDLFVQGCLKRWMERAGSVDYAWRPDPEKAAA